MIASSIRPRMGHSDECAQRWPDIDATDPDNWNLEAIFVASNPPDGYGFLGQTYADPQYKGAPDAIVRIFHLEGSDHATWAIVTDAADKVILIADDIGD